jgi:Flp pilus assembly protein CpaB
MTYNVRNIAIALVLAAIAAFMVIAYTGDVKKKANSRQDTVSVLKATTDIPAGTLASEAIASGKLKVEKVVAQDEIPLAVHEPTELDGTHISGQPIFNGQQITAAMFAPSSQTSIVSRIDETNRAVEIKLGKQAILSGTLKAGDHVDLVGSFTVHPSNGGSDFDVSRIIVRDVEVLQAPQSAAAGTNLGQGAAADDDSVIIKVSDAVVPKIMFALRSGDGALWFALRPSASCSGNAGDKTHGCDGTTTLATVKSVVFDGLTTAQIIQAISVPLPKAGN